MKVLVLMSVAVAVVMLLVMPADAATKKAKKAPVQRAPLTLPHSNPNVVYDNDGTILGVDPDPFIRMMIRRDPRPWDSDL